jgi:hypothetical protein
METKDMLASISIFYLCLFAVSPSSVEEKKNQFSQKIQKSQD